MTDIMKQLRDFQEMPVEGGTADPLIEVLHGVAEQAADEIAKQRRVISAAIEMARSEVAANVDGTSDTVEFESWPEMDTLFVILDEYQPGWRKEVAG